ncbi:MAG: chromate efflux transporter [Acidobacteriia bacterium]|nr:chromate efflux transporter [Terriglobia bacterium]
MPTPPPHSSSSLPDAGERGNLREMAAYFLRLGTLGFGGPIALAGHMHKDLVEDRQWITDRDYVEGLAFSQLSPGPLAAQLAMYLGWVRFRALGATLIGIAFILPSFLMVLGLALLYVHYGSLGWIRAVFYGVGAAVIAILLRSAYKLMRSTLKRDPLLWLLFAATALVTAWTAAEIVWLFLICGLVALLLKAPPAFLRRPSAPAALGGLGWLTQGLQGPATLQKTTALFLFFLKAGAFVFGSGLAIVPFLYGGVVVQTHWLSERQFLDAVAVAMITPGPVVITAGFIGYLVAGLAGALLASLAVFVPPYFIVLLAAPLYRKFTRNPQVGAFVQGVTAAAIGAITGAVFILGKRALVDIPSLFIAAVTLAVLLATKKIPEPVLILLAGLAGFLLFQGPR